MKSAGRCSCAHNQPALEALAKLAKQCSVSGRNKFRFAIMRAMKSLQAYPLPIASEREAMQLEGVGNFMANEIMKAIRHAAALGMEDAENVAAPANGVRRVRADSCGGGGGAAVEGADDDAGVVSFSQLSQASEFADLSQTSQVEMELSQSRPASRPSKEYVPEAGRGPWILLVTLYIAGGSGSRLEILQQAATVEACGLAKTTLAASWASSVRTLMSKDLVQKTTGTVYSLTETGSAAAESAHEAYLAAMRELPQESAVNELQSSQSSQSQSQSQSQGGVRRKISPADRSTGESPALVRQRSDPSGAATVAASSFSRLRSTVLLQLSDDEAEEDRQKQAAQYASLSAADTLLQLDLTQQSAQTLPAEATAMLIHANFERRQLIRAATYPAAAACSASRTATITATSSSTTESVRFVGGSPSDWTVMLLIDHREEDAELIQTSMLCQGFACETLQLAVGDFLWVARHKTLSGEQVVLDVVLERKTVNDLAASIIDGRYNEQKVRLKQAAIPTSAYIIEGNLSAQDRMDPGSLRTAMTTTEVIHGLRVIPTRNIDHSIRVIQSLFEQQVRAWPQTFEAFISGRRAPVSFADFQKKFVKRSAQTVGDVFRAQLRQIPNCSATRASVLNRQFETMRQMLQHFDRLPDRKAIEQSLTTLQSDQRTRPIGPALAKFITRLYLDEF